MLEASNAIQIVLPFLYGTLLFGFLRVFVRPGRKRLWLFPVVLIALFLHALYIGLYTILAGHCLLTTSHELFSLIAFTLLTTYVIVELRPDELSAAAGTI